MGTVWSGLHVDASIHLLMSLCQQERVTKSFRMTEKYMKYEPECLILKENTQVSFWLAVSPRFV